MGGGGALTLFCWLGKRSENGESGGGGKGWCRVRGGRGMVEAERWKNCGQARGLSEPLALLGSPRLSPAITAKGPPDPTTLARCGQPTPDAALWRGWLASRVGFPPPRGDFLCVLARGCRGWVEGGTAREGTQAKPEALQKGPASPLCDTPRNGPLAPPSFPPLLALRPALRHLLALPA